MAMNGHFYKSLEEGKEDPPSHIRCVKCAGLLCLPLQTHVLLFAISDVAEVVFLLNLLARIFTETYSCALRMPYGGHTQPSNKL